MAVLTYPDEVVGWFYLFFSLKIHERKFNLTTPQTVVHRQIMKETIYQSSSMWSFLILIISFSWIVSADIHEDFVQCFSQNSQDPTSASKVTYTQDSPSFPSVLQFSIQNPRFNTSATPKPLVIVTPLNASHIQAVVTCAQKYGLLIRIRSGGHDYEGLSYVSVLPFILIDLINFREITIDITNKTSWVQAGATIGELYYSIGNKSRTLAFPAGVCPSVGVGGHFSGGGYGPFMRKYGLAADNIVDAHLIDVQGRILDRESMGEDLFWAIRGGGGNSFGVVIAWKIKLVEVPPIVTFFNLPRTLEQNATKLVYRWQHVANKPPDDLLIMLLMTWQRNSSTALATFRSLYLGGLDSLLQLMQENFPELGLAKQDCTEMSWVESTVAFAGFPLNTSLSVLLSRNFQMPNFKVKSDYVKEPMPEYALEAMWEKFREAGVEGVQIVLSPYGGKMEEISESSIPYPHRAGNIYKFAPMVWWNEEGMEASVRHINWSRRFYSYLTPFVSKNPREAYVNYRDLDIGVNNQGNTTYRQAKIWGAKYFKNNFDRLVRVKSAVDPTNFFRNEQSIPPLLPY